MIDIHHHLLFGLDDGPKDLESSVAQAEAAAANGITHIACTPHANDTWSFIPSANRERLEAIRDRVGDVLTLGLGCDFHLSPGNIAEALENPTKFTINQGNYLLVEFAEFMIPQSIGETFAEFLSRGVRPILTHPERNPVLQKEPERMAPWLRMGCVVQITAGSLGGRFGKRAEAMSWELLEKKWVHFLATDAHNLDRRPPALRQAYEAVARQLGEATAERLCVDNPRAAFTSGPWLAQPEPEGLGASEPSTGKSLASRLFGR